MKTRKSWRNQERLWNAIKNEDATQKEIVTPVAICGNCKHYKSQRNRTFCAIANRKVNCIEKLDCYEKSR